MSDKELEQKIIKGMVQVFPVAFWQCRDCGRTVPAPEGERPSYCPTDHTLEHVNRSYQQVLQEIIALTKERDEAREDVKKLESLEARVTALGGGIN